jgi:hypothetical protein
MTRVEREQREADDRSRAEARAEAHRRVSVVKEANDAFREGFPRPKDKDLGTQT